MTKVVSTTLWNQTYGGTSWDMGYCVEQTDDAGYIITGYITNISDTDDIDVWLIKTNSTGCHEWNQTYGGTGDDRGWCVDNTSDGGFIITGVTKSFGAGYSDVWLIKTDDTGSSTPFIDLPADVTYEEGTTGNSITWYP